MDFISAAAMVLFRRREFLRTSGFRPWDILALTMRNQALPAMV
jgi:hypothetical protein